MGLQSQLTNNTHTGLQELQARQLYKPPSPEVQAGALRDGVCSFVCRQKQSFLVLQLGPNFSFSFYIIL